MPTAASRVTRPSRAKKPPAVKLFVFESSVGEIRLKSMRAVQRNFVVMEASADRDTERLYVEFTRQLAEPGSLALIRQLDLEELNKMYADWAVWSKADGGLDTGE